MHKKHKVCLIIEIVHTALAQFIQFLTYIMQYHTVFLLRFCPFTCCDPEWPWANIQGHKGSV